MRSNLYNNFSFFPGQNSNKYLIKGQVHSCAKKDSLIIFPPFSLISRQRCFVLQGYLFNNKSDIIKLQALLISHKIPKQLVNSFTTLKNSFDVCFFSLIDLIKKIDISSNILLLLTVIC